MQAMVGDGRSEGDAAEVGQGVFVEAGGDAAPVFEPVEAAFDGVAVPVQVAVEVRWSPAAGAFGRAAGDLVGPFGDGVCDACLAQPGAGGVVGVGLVGQQVPQ